ncbi:hypothetical protein M569_01430 [Genlisea aurea]|uniref:Uncharacterized protein n=1 Tax=Genlisea aurea TaxID=192259 RepID=S8EBR5_9LAMI|nr:hypothetical protein M569_01430 [Genlisea aurea]
MASQAPLSQDAPQSQPQLIKEELSSHQQQQQQPQSQGILQEAGNQVRSVAQGAAEVGKSAVNMARGAAESVKNTLGINNNASEPEESTDASATNTKH